MRGGGVENIVMTITWLQQFFPDATEEKWHRHENGGGWIHNKAFVPASTFVAETALVTASASIGARCGRRLRPHRGRRRMEDFTLTDPRYARSALYQCSRVDWSGL